jgi:hypothetical protein
MGNNMFMTAIAVRPALIAAALLLAGCAPTAPTTAEGDAPATSPEGPSTDCSIYAGQTDPELKLFTTSAIVAGPAEGQVFGDGTELSITLSQEAIDAGLVPLFDLNTLSESGGPVAVSGLIFDPTTGADGTYSTSLLEFGNDELVGKAVVAVISAVSDATVGDAEPYGDRLLLGNYCLTYANDGS